MVRPARPDGQGNDHFLAAEAWDEGRKTHGEQGQCSLETGRRRDPYPLGAGVARRRHPPTPRPLPELRVGIGAHGPPDRGRGLSANRRSSAGGTSAPASRNLDAQIHIARARHDWARTIELSQQALANIPPDLHEVRAAVNLNLGLALWRESRTIAAEHAFAAAHESAGRSRNHYIRLLALGLEAMTQVAQGRMRATFNRLRQALDADGHYPASAMIYIVLGALHYEWNNLAEAEATCDKAIALALRGGNAEVLGSAYRLSAEISLARGNFVAAKAAINAATNAAGDDAPPLTNARNAAASVRSALAENDLGAATYLVEQMPTAGSCSVFHPPLNLAQARLHLAEGDTSAAFGHLASEYARAEEAGWHYAQVEIRILQALAAATPEQAQVFLLDALPLAQEQGLRRTFLDQGKGLIPLLQLAASRSEYADTIRRLLTAFDRAPAVAITQPRSTVIAEAPPMVEPLSERELEVLQLLAHGHTNQEIARMLVVSVNTVKSHLKNIYGKLGARNRREAVAQARAEKLLDG